MFILAAVEVVCGQTIEYRNNCLDSCNIDLNTRQNKIQTVLEVNSPTVFALGTRFKWKIDGRSLPTQVDKSSVTYIFSSKGSYQAELVIEEPGFPSKTLPAKTIKIGGVPSVSGNGVGFLINDDIKDTLVEMCAVSSKQLRVNSFYLNPNYRITWYPNGETSSSISVDKEGCYSAKVFEVATGCYYEAKTVVKYCGDAKVDLPTTASTGSSCESCPRWDVGNNSRVLFDENGNPTSEIISGISVPNNSSVISIPKHDGANLNLGGLTFNGEVLYDFSGRLIEMVTKGDKNFPQGVTIIPKDKCKGCNSVYYMFSTKRDGNSNKFYYHIFDVSKNGGLGGFIQKDILIQNASSAGKIEVLYRGGYNYTIFNLDEKQENLYVYNIDSLGVSDADIVNLGVNIPSAVNNFGTIKLNRLGDKLAISISPNRIKIIDLTQNPVSVLNQLAISGGEINGIEFSPNGDLLYASVYFPSTGRSEVHQFDLTNSIVSSSNVFPISTFGKLGEIMFDPVNNSKLFITRAGSSTFFTIDLPNTRIIDLASATLAGVNENGFTVVSGTLGLGLPKLVPNPPSNDSPQIDVSCDGIDYQFSAGKDLCENNKNTEVIYNIYSALGPLGRSLGIIQDPTTRQKIVNPVVTTLVKTINKSSGVNSNINQIYFDFDANTSPFPDGYYIIEVKVRNNCMSPGKYYFYEPVGFDLHVLRPFKLKNQIDVISSANFGNSTSCVFSNYNVIPSLVTSTTSPMPTVPPKDLIVPGGYPITYNWSNHTINPILSVPFPSGAGNYSLEIRDPLTGCSDRASTNIKFYTENDLPPRDNWNICMDNPSPLVRLSIFPNSINLSFDWTVLSSGNIFSPSPWNQNNIRVDQNGHYKVVVTDDYQCRLERTYDVDDLCQALIIAPTVFNPKVAADGTPTKFYPMWNWPEKDFIAKPTSIPGSAPSRNYTKTRSKIHSFKVFNRWGQLIFQQDFDPATFNINANFDIKNFGWDGTYRGILVPQDTYAWIIDYESLDFPKGKETKSGAVLIVY